MVFEGDDITKLIVNIAVSGALLAIIAVGFSLVYRVAKILHIAHGVVVVASSYAFWWAVERGASVVFSCAFALAVSLALGWCMHAFVYERLRRRGKVPTTLSLIAAFALLILGQNVLVALFGREEQFVPFAKEWSPFQFGAVSSVQFFVIVCSLFFIFATMVFLRRGRLGKIMRAVADDETAAETAGIDAKQIRCTAFLAASLLAGIAGILYAAILPFSSVTVIEIAIWSSAAAILGGAGSLAGAFFGGFILAFVGDVGVLFTSEGYRAFFLFVFVFIFLFIRPHGLFNHKS